MKLEEPLGVPTHLVGGTCVGRSVWTDRVETSLLSTFFIVIVGPALVGSVVHVPKKFSANALEEKNSNDEVSIKNSGRIADISPADKGKVDSLREVSLKKAFSIL